MKTVKFRKPYSVLLSDRTRSNTITDETFHACFTQIDDPEMWDGIIRESEKEDYEPEELKKFRIFEEMTEEEVKEEIQHIYGQTNVKFYDDQGLKVGMTYEDNDGTWEITEIDGDDVTVVNVQEGNLNEGEECIVSVSEAKYFVTHDWNTGREI